jgi:aquaporin Z
MAGERPGWGAAFARHWPEYLMEAWGLGTFMVSAGLFATLLEYPGSPVHRALDDPLARRLLMGIAMGLTAVCIIYSRWGKQSGAHINPAVTLTFLRLGKVKPIDAAFYIGAQFLGGTVGVMIVWLLLGDAFAAPPVFFINTMPGPAGVSAAFATEVGMSCALMLMVLSLLESKRFMPRIGIIAGVFVAIYIATLSPVSGFSINPARSFASAVPGGFWDFLWVYFTAPVIGMLAAVEIFRLVGRGKEKFCAKLNHDYALRCIHCGHRPPTTEPVAAAAAPGCGDGRPQPLERGMAER